jgi:hypothetical protein
MHEINRPGLSALQMPEIIFMDRDGPAKLTGGHRVCQWSPTWFDPAPEKHSPIVIIHFKRRMPVHQSLQREGAAVQEQQSLAAGLARPGIPRRGATGVCRQPGIARRYLLIGVNDRPEWLRRAIVHHDDLERAGTWFSVSECPQRHVKSVTRTVNRDNDR